MLSRLAELQGGQHAQASLMRLLASCDIPQHISEFPDEFVTHALLPSTWIGLIHGYRHEFVHRLGADRQRLVSFWESFLSRPANEGLAANHPVVGGKRPEELATTVPLTVHADAGPFTKTTACYCVSFSPLLGAGEAHFTKYLVASYVQKKSSPETDYPFWTRLLDNLLQLGSGVVDGQEVARDADGTLWTFALVFVKADEDVRANDFALVHFEGKNEACPECMANRDTRPFTDMSAEAGWRPSEAMPLIAYQARMREPHHPLTDHAFFCHRYFFPIDMMHLLEGKGVSGLAFGSVLLWLTETADWVGTETSGWQPSIHCDCCTTEQGQGRWCCRRYICRTSRGMVGETFQACLQSSHHTPRSAVVSGNSSAFTAWEQGPRMSVCDRSSSPWMTCTRCCIRRLCSSLMIKNFGSEHWCWISGGPTRGSENLAGALVFSASQ